MSKHADDWNKVKHLTFDQIKKNPLFTNDHDHNQIWQYIHKLEQAGFKPRETHWYTIKHETVDEYIKRAMQEAAKNGESLPKAE